MKIRILVLGICIGLIGGILFVPNVVADSTATVTVEIYRIVAQDPIDDGSDEADWYFYVGMSQDGGTTYQWTSSSIPMVDNKDNWYVPSSKGNIEFSGITTTSVTIAIIVCEEDGWPGSDDLADISDDSIGGIDNIGDPISPGVRRGTYVGYYNLKTNTLTGDEIVEESIEEPGYHKTSGEHDGNSGDENDAAVYFNITDNYDEPTAYMTVTNYHPDVDELVNFDGSDSTGSLGSTINRYQWDFNNDGVWDAEGETTSFTYTSADTYTAILKVTDTLEETATHSQTITVSSIPPIAGFTYSPDDYPHPTTLDTIQFTDTSNDPDGTISSWYWDFDDWTTSTENNPTHKYISGGTYTVSLTVTDNDGETDTETKYITVIELADITGTVTDSDGNPISIVTIKLYDAGTSTVLETTTTNTNGVYTISEIETGTYDIEAFKSGYDNNKKTNKIIYSGENTVAFVLTAQSTPSDDKGKGSPGFDPILIFLIIILVGLIFAVLIKFIKKK